MSKKSANYRVDKIFADFDGSKFSMAIKNLLSEPIFGDVSEYTKSPEDTYNLKLTFCETEDRSLIDDLKEFYKITSDVELFRLVLHVAKNNPLFWGHTPKEQTCSAESE